MFNFETQISHYKIYSILGECCEKAGTVQLAKHTPSGQMVAIKKFNMDKIKDDVKLIEHEIILTRQLQHPNILKYFATFVNGQEVWVVSPLMGFGSCRDLLNVHFTEGLPESAIALILKDVLEGLDYIHKKGIIHRAIKASHILISSNGEVCLSGLRYSCPVVQHGKWQRQIHAFPSSTMKNLNWLSPELLEQNMRGYNEKSDIYSLGIVLCELANGAEPFADISTTLMLTEKVRGSLPQLLDCNTLPAEDAELHGDSDLAAKFRKQSNRKFSDGLHEIAALCLQHEAYNRPTTSQLLTHPYLKFNKRCLYLPELLKPAIPLNNCVVNNSNEMASLENIQKLSELDLQAYEWEF